MPLFYPRPHPFGRTKIHYHHLISSGKGNIHRWEPVKYETLFVCIIQFHLRLGIGEKLFSVTSFRLGMAIASPPSLRGARLRALFCSRADARPRRMAGARAMRSRKRERSDQCPQTGFASNHFHFTSDKQVNCEHFRAPTKTKSENGIPHADWRKGEKAMSREKAAT